VPDDDTAKHAHTHTDTHTRAHARAHTHTHIRQSTHTHTHTHTHKHTQQSTPNTHHHFGRPPFCLLAHGALNIIDNRQPFTKEELWNLVQIEYKGRVVEPEQSLDTQCKGIRTKAFMYKTKTHKQCKSSIFYSTIT
jgi:hypothetical protein